MNTRLILISILTLLLSLSFQPTSDAAANPLQEISDISNLLNQENVTIDSWEVLFKEEMSQSEVTIIRQKLNSYFPGVTFQTEQTDDLVKHIMEYTSALGVTETFTILEQTATNQQLEVQYRLSGNVWNAEVSNYYTSKLENLLRSLFTSKVKKFACTKTVTNDRIKSDYVFKNVKNHLNLQDLDKNLQEHDFFVMSGYTSKWENAISIADKSINFQMAIREGLGTKTTITIGTPIIVTEY